MVEMYDNKDLKADKTYLVTLGGQQGFGDWTFWAGYQYAKDSQMMPARKAAPDRFERFRCDTACCNCSYRIQGFRRRMETPKETMPTAKLMKTTRNTTFILSEPSMNIRLA